MFVLIMLYVLIGGMSFLGSISLMKNGPRYAGLHFAYGVAQLILIASLLLSGHFEMNIISLIILVLGLIGTSNLMLWYNRVWRINFILGVSQIVLYGILL